jgi:ribonuclease HI
LAEAARQYYPASADDNDDNDEPPPKPCHNYKVAFVDGACLGNGQAKATAGIGIAIGANAMTMHWAIPVDDDIDPSFVRTSQRAELLAALHGIGKLAEFENHPSDKHEETDSKTTWVITSDSEYVVLGMTEWVPNWGVSHAQACYPRPHSRSHLSQQSNGWRNSSGRRPKNLDLFQRLDGAVDNYEREYGVRIAFWRISRVHNELADELAGFAAKGHIVEPVQFEYVHLTFTTLSR